MIFIVVATQKVPSPLNCNAPDRNSERSPTADMNTLHGTGRLFTDRRTYSPAMNGGRAAVGTRWLGLLVYNPAPIAGRSATAFPLARISNPPVVRGVVPPG
jgi:hypothetical protein